MEPLSFHPVEVLFFRLLDCFNHTNATVVWWAFKLGMVIGPLHAHIDDLGAIVKGPAHHYLHHAFKDGTDGGFATGIWDKFFDTELDNSGTKDVQYRE